VFVQLPTKTAAAPNEPDAIRKLIISVRVTYQGYRHPGRASFNYLVTILLGINHKGFLRFLDYLFGLDPF